MNNSELNRIVSKWLEDPDNEELRKELEAELKEDPESLVSFKQLQLDFKDATTNKIPENPFFFSKLKFRMEKGKVENAHIQRVRWATYAATLSLSIVMGIFLGNQVESNAGSESGDQFLTEELFVEDYTIDNNLLLDIQE